MPYIYKIINDINNKIYVGKTLSTIEERFKKHCSDSKKATCKKRPLYDAMNKYGIEHFHIELIEECSLEVVNDREIYWINTLNSYHNGYNATLGGDGAHYIDYDKILELWNKGYNNKQISLELNISTDTVQKALIIFNISAEERHKRGLESVCNKVLMLDIETEEVLNEFNSVTEALKFLGISKSDGHIGAVCKGKRRTAYGYKWRYSSLSCRLDQLKGEHK